MRTIVNLFAAAGLLLAAGCSSGPAEPAFQASPSRPAQTSPRQNRKDKLVKLLSGPERPREEELRALGAGVDSDLADVANSRTTTQSLRLRAIECMGYFQNRRSQLLLRSVLTDPNWDTPFRAAALEATARAFGAESFETVKQYTLDSDQEMRLAAVRALVTIGSENALALLKTIQLAERNPIVLEAIDQAIVTLGRSPLEVR